MIAIELDHVDLGFGKNCIVSDLTANIVDGEFIGIFGPNGAGKTLLCRSILGLIQPLRGKISLYGKPTHRGNPAIGYMPQLRPRIEAFSLSGRAYLSATMNGTAWGIPFMNREKKRKLERIVKLVLLENQIDEPFSNYSGGERQRLALAQALLGDPKVLLLDEPLSSLDLGQQKNCIDLICSIQRELHITVLFTAHQITPLMGIMTHVIYLAHGKAAIGTVEEVINRKTLSWLYGIPVEVIQVGRNVTVLPTISERDDHDDWH